MADTKKHGGKKSEQISRPLLITITVFAVASVLLLGFAIAMAIIKEGSKSYDRLDYINDDLSGYIEFDESAYKDYDIEIDIPSVSDVEVENEILKALAKNKGSLLYEGHYVLNRPAKAGDKVYIYYRGYELDADGNQIDLDGTCNFSDSTPTELTLGGGQFIAGFELGLIGVVPEDYSKFEKATDGAVKDGDVLYCTLSYIEETGSDIHQNEKVRIDLKDPRLEEKWGIGIEDFLREETIGSINIDAITLIKAKSNEKITYTSAEVNYATRCEENPKVVKTVFPYDYQSEEFRNKTVYFDVYIEKALCYETAELDEAFITDKLKLSSEFLSEYKGEGLVEKYRSYVRAELEAEREDEKRYEAADKMWEKLKEKISVKKYPESELRRIFDDYYYNHQLEFAENYATYYESIDKYLKEYYDVGDGGDWRAVLNEQVKNEVWEKLIFYSILKKENLVPTDEQFEKIYQKELEFDFEYYGKTRKDFDTEEKYLEALEKYEKQVLEYYGEEFYIESVYYNYAVDKMLDFANIVNKAIQK